MALASPIFPIINSENGNIHTTDIPVIVILYEINCEEAPNSLCKYKLPNVVSSPHNNPQGAIPNINIAEGIDTN